MQDWEKQRAEMEKTHRVTVMGGQDRLKGKIVRIGHMGYIRNEDLLATIEALGRSLEKLKAGSLSDARLAKAIAIANQILAEKT